MDVRQYRIFSALIAIFSILLTVEHASADQYTLQNYLQIKSARSGDWSPDGKQIAFLSNETGTYQIYLVSAEGGKPKPLTKYSENVSFLRFSPTRPEIIFGMDEGGNEKTQLYMLDAQTGNITRMTHDDNVIHNFGAWSHDGDKFAFAYNKRDKKYFDIDVMKRKSQKRRLVLQHDAYNEAAAWSWDDKYLVVSTWESNYDNNLTLLKLKNLRDLLLTPHTGWATYTHVNWPKGENDHFYLISDLGNPWSKLAKYLLKKETIEFQDNSPMWNTESLTLSRDGKRVAYTINVDGYSQPFIIDIPTQKLLGPLKMPGGIIESPRFSPDGEKLMFQYQSPTAPPDIHVYDIAKNELIQLTHSDMAGIESSAFVDCEIVKYAGFGGLKIPGFLYKPKGLKKDGSNPVLIYAHGGPEGQIRPYFSRFFQYLVSRGISVFAPNVRGSDGYGKAYIHLDDKRNRLNSIRDYAAANYYLRNMGYFAKDKIGIYGGSYGGYVVYASLTEYPDLYACGVSVVGIGNFISFLENTGPWRRKIREAEYGSLEEDRHFLESISPLNKAEAIKSPLMIVQGANDPRVPQSEADQMAAAMKKNNIPVEYLLYSDEGHGLSKLKNRLDAYPKIVDFLNRYMATKSESVEEKDNSDPPAVQ